MFHGVRYSDAEAAFHAHTMGMSFEYQQEDVLKSSRRNFANTPSDSGNPSGGGVAWLERCWHRTGARTAGFARWEDRAGSRHTCGP